MSATRHEDVEPLLHREQEASHNARYTSTSTSIDIRSSQNIEPSNADRLQYHREMVRERFSANWWLEWIIIMIVFSVTGSSTMLVVRPLMRILGFTGSLGAGPWSFRIAYIILTFPLYSCMLLLISTLVCRRPYFEHLLIKMWSRLIPKRVLNRFSRQEQTV